MESEDDAEPPPNGYSIRAVTPDEWPEIKDGVMRIEIIDFSPSGMDENEDEMGEAFVDPRSICYVARDAAGDIVAYLVALPLESMGYLPRIREDGEFGKGSTFYLSSVAVHPGHQGRGLGRRLIAELVAEAGKRGYSRITGHFLEHSAEVFRGLGGRVVKFYPDFYKAGSGAKYMEMYI